MVERVALAAEQEPPRRVAEHVDVRVRDGRHDARRGLVLAHVEPGVDAGDDEVEAREHLVGEVHRPAAQDVDLRAVEDAEADALGLVVGVELADGLALLVELLDAEPVRDLQAPAVVADAEVAQPPLARRVAHLAQRVRAVAGRRVVVDGALQVGRADERRERLVGDRQPVRVVAQRRGDRVEAGGGVDRVLIGHVGQRRERGHGVDVLGGAGPLEPDAAERGVA